MKDSFTFIHKNHNIRQSYKQEYIVSLFWLTRNSVSILSWRLRQQYLTGMPVPNWNKNRLHKIFDNKQDLQWVKICPCHWQHLPLGAGATKQPLIKNIMPPVSENRIRDQVYPGCSQWTFCVVNELNFQTKSNQILPSSLLRCGPWVTRHVCGWHGRWL